jgi:uncharacterized OB-fold protein
VFGFDAPPHKTGVFGDGYRMVGLWDAGGDEGIVMGGCPRCAKVSYPPNVSCILQSHTKGMITVRLGGVDSCLTRRILLDYGQGEP